jgi:Flp pilus assembly CpaE family ATPase
MQESKRVVLVCTPEIPSIHLAREKLAFMRDLGLDSRLALVLNRVPKRPMFTTKQVEEVLGLKVVAEFANDYYAVNKATTAGIFLEAESTIARQCTDFVNTLLERRQSLPPAGKKKFLQYFAVPHPLVSKD